MNCKYCAGLLYDTGLYPIVKCNVCGKIAIDYTEQLYREMTEHAMNQASTTARLPAPRPNYANVSKHLQKP